MLVAVTLNKLLTHESYIDEVRLLCNIKTSFDLKYIQWFYSDTKPTFVLLLLKLSFIMSVDSGILQLESYKLHW